jgi:hypothetical protein
MRFPSPLLTLSLLLGLLQVCLAHPQFQNQARFEYSDTEIRARIQVSVKEICAAAGIPIDAEGTVDRISVEDAAPKHVDYFLKHFQVEVNGEPWSPEVEKIKEPLTWNVEITNSDAADPNQITAGSRRDRPDRIYFQFFFIHPCAEPPRTIAISHNMMAEIPYTPNTPYDIGYAYSFTKDGGDPGSIGLIKQNEVYIHRTDHKQTAGEQFVMYLKHGLIHVIGGYDHLLFAAALVLALRSFWEAFKIIGLFTIAHSISVTLAAYGLLNLPAGFPKEQLIAGSIVFVALENVFFPKSTLGWRRIILVFVFGLIHGLGFAEVFTESMAGLDKGRIALALVAFCLGVEMAHLCVVAPLCVLMGWGRKTGGDTFQKRAQLWGSLLVAVGGFYFFANSMEWLPPHLTPEALLGAK